MPETNVEITSLRFDVKMVVAIVAFVLTVAGAGWAIRQEVKALQGEVSDQKKTIETLTQQQKATERAVIELTTALRVKEVIR